MTVEHGPHAVVQAWELGAWVSRRLGWRLHAGKANDGVEIAWCFSTPQGPRFVRVRRLEQGPPEVRRIRLACTMEGRPAVLNFVVEEEGRRLAIQLEGVEGAPADHDRTVAHGGGVNRPAAFRPGARSGVSREHGGGPRDGAKFVVNGRASQWDI